MRDAFEDVHDNPSPFDDSFDVKWNETEPGPQWKFSRLANRSNIQF